MLYYLLIGLCFISYYIYNIIECKYRNVFQKTIVFIIALFLCCGYMTGTDWRTYEISYQWMTPDTFFSTILFWEPGFTLYTSLFRFLEIDFWNYLIITKFITFYIFIEALNKYCEKQYFFLALTFFVVFYGFFFWIDNPLRNLIAYAVFLLSIPSLIERKMWKYMLIICVATLFHYSAVILFPLYWLLHSRIKNTIIVLIYILFSIVFLKAEIIFLIIDYLFGWFPIIANKLLAYSGQIGEVDGKMFSLGFVLHNVFFILLLLSRKKMESMKYGAFLFNSAVLYVFLFRIGLTFTVFMRFAMFCALFYSISVVSVLCNLEIRSKFLYKSYLFLVIFMVSWFSLIKDSRYIPYSSYLTYLFQDKPDYDYRYYYNDRHSPYPPLYR